MIVTDQFRATWVFRSLGYRIFIGYKQVLLLCDEFPCCVVLAPREISIVLLCIITIRDRAHCPFQIPTRDGTRDNSRVGVGNVRWGGTHSLLLSRQSFTASSGTDNRIFKLLAYQYVGPS